VGGIILKSPEEIEYIRQSSLLVGKTLAEVARWIAPGIAPLKLDKIAEQFILDHKATPVFLGYGGFPNSLCISVNSVVCMVYRIIPLLKTGILSQWIAE
jgi:methionyl aminopeptidase